MTESRATASISVPADELFTYLSRVSNLPEYFPHMMSASSVDGGDAVHTTAKLDDGTTVEGEAWFRADPDARSIEWGSEGDNNYHGELAVESAGPSTSRLEITLHTEREEIEDLDDDLQEVLDRIASIVGPDASD